MSIRPKNGGFQVDVTVGGKRAPRVTAPTEKEARLIEAQFRADLLAGRDPVSPAGRLGGGSALILLRQLIETTYRARWQGQKSEGSSLLNAEAWSDALGADFPVTCLTPDVVVDVTDSWAAKGNAAGTINRKLAALSVMLGVAEERGWVPKRFKLPRRKEYEGRLRWYSDAEVDDILVFFRDDTELRALIEVAVDTGLRLGELQRLRVEDVDLDGRKVTVWESKGNRPRSLPLTKQAHGALAVECGGKRRGERVFPERFTSGYLRRRLLAWKDSYGLPADDEGCFHTFRHTCCARLVQRGVPIPVVQKWMGHSTIQTTMRYAHLAPDSLDIARAALEPAGVAERQTQAA
jgi:integrase